MTAVASAPAVSFDKPDRDGQPAVLVGLLVCKIALGTFFASHFLYALFVPFLTLSVSGGVANPWQAAAEIGIADAFPYGPVMFYIMVVPRLLVSWAVSPEPEAFTWLHLLAARIPLLAADLAILALLVWGLGTHGRRGAVLWWASPIVLYVTYVHGQLDVIPTAILLASLVLLVDGRYVWAAVALGLGLATKTHLMVALPFMAVFVARRETSWGLGMSFVGIALAVYAASLFPWVLNPAFRQMVFGTAEQGRLFRAGIDYLPTLKVYLAPLAIGLLFLQFASYRDVTKDTLLMFLGLSYTVLITLMPPAHGYYVWPLPFVVYFFAQQTVSSRVPLWAFNFSCLVYLMLGLDSTLFESGQLVWPRMVDVEAPVLLLARLGVDVTVLNSLLYTFVQVSVLFIAIMMYRHGVQSNIIYRPRTRPIVVGIGGDSGSGKHTARDLIAGVLGETNVITVDGDDVHRWERGHERWRVVSHLNPGGNDLHLLLDQTRALGRGQPITKARYEHGSGRFTKQFRVSPSRFVFVVGLHPFYLKRMRDLMNIKVYMDTEDELRMAWKTERDVRRRGYTPGQVVEQAVTREPDAETFIRPQRQFADMVVRYYRPPGADRGDGDQSILGIDIQVDNSVPLEALVEEFGKCGRAKASLRQEDDLIHQRLVVEGWETPETIQRIATEMIIQVGELTAVRPKWQGGHNGVLQLCFLMVLSDRWRYGLDQID